MDKWKKDRAVTWALWGKKGVAEAQRWWKRWSVFGYLAGKPPVLSIWPHGGWGYDHLMKGPMSLCLWEPLPAHLIGSGGQALLCPLRLILYHQSGLVGKSAASGATQPGLRSYCQLPCYFCSLVIVFGSPSSQAPLAESWSPGPDPTLPTGLMSESRTKVSGLSLLPRARQWLLWLWGHTASVTTIPLSYWQQTNK